MPITYSGIFPEHAAVRSAVGMFDLSHMGQLVADGEGVEGWLDGLTVNDVAGMRLHQARYNIFTNERGGAHDDVIIYKSPARWLIVVNAANTDKIWQLLQATRPAGIRLENRTLSSALIALQGPLAECVLQEQCKLDLSSLRYYVIADTRIRGHAVEVARTGYTGEDGFEVFAPAAAAAKLWESFMTGGKGGGLRPCGLGARDVLRLEAGMPLYGHELDEDITPLQAGLDWAVKLEKAEFTGKAALLEQRASNTYDRIAGLIMEGKAPARAGYGVFAGGRRVGQIRSGSPAPSVGAKNIATALVERTASAEGTALTVEIRGTHHPARVVRMPFYRRQRPLAQKQ